MRDIDSGVAAAIAASGVLCVWLVQFDFASGIVYLNTSNADIVYDGHTWLRGQALMIEPIIETDSGVSTGFTVSVATAGEALLARALSEYPQGRPCSIGMLVLDASSGAVVGAPTIEVGICDAPTIREGPGGAVVSISVETEFADYSRPRVFRYTNADQQSRFPGDRICEYTEQMVEKAIAFPSREAQL